MSLGRSYVWRAGPRRTQRLCSYGMAIGFALVLADSILATASTRERATGEPTTSRAWAGAPSLVRRGADDYAR